MFTTENFFHIFYYGICSSSWLFLGQEWTPWSAQVANYNRLETWLNITSQHQQNAAYNNTLCYKFYILKSRYCLSYHIYLFIKYSKIDSRYYIQFLSYLIQSIEGIKRVFFSIYFFFLLLISHQRCDIINETSGVNLEQPNVTLDFTDIYIFFKAKASL